MINLIEQKQTLIITKHNALTMFKGSNNYKRIASNYINFIILNNLDLNFFSRDIYLNSIKASLSKGSLSVYKTAVNKFLTVAIDFKVLSIKPDTEIVLNENVQETLEGYILYFISELEAKPSTKNTYKKALMIFKTFIESNNLSLTKKAVLDFKDSLNLSPYTVNIYLASVRQFTLFLIDRQETIFKGRTATETSLIIKELTRINKVKNLKIDTSELIKDIFSKNEIKTLLDNTTKKNALIIGLLYFCGLRTIEVVRLDLKDINLKNNTLNILGKGRDTKQLVQINDTLKEMLTAYISTNKVGSLFPGLTTAQIRKNINKVLNRLNLKHGEKKRSCHSFRHSFCVHLIESGLPLHTVQVLARHKSITTTESYIKKLQVTAMRKKGLTNVLSF